MIRTTSISDVAENIARIDIEDFLESLGIEIPATVRLEARAQSGVGSQVEIEVVAIESDDV